jgi:hypothetical protein
VKSDNDCKISRSASKQQDAVLFAARVDYSFAHRLLPCRQFWSDISAKATNPRKEVRMKNGDVCRTEQGDEVTITESTPSGVPTGGQTSGGTDVSFPGRSGWSGTANVGEDSDGKLYTLPFDD